MTILFPFPGNESLADLLIAGGRCERGQVMVRNFPDGESLVQIESDIKGKTAVVLCTLDRPDEKAMTLMFFAETARELGAKSVKLIAPYLGYMRQDKRFHEGESITSNIFAAFLSQHFDGLITIDPHLHRHKDMKEIYKVPVTVVHAADAIAIWIRKNIEKPVLIGPDEESDQWVKDIAKKAQAPYTVLTKIRRGDHDVEVSVPDIDQFHDHTPVLVDDIISTARTMIETVNHLKTAAMKPAVCIGIHAVFSGDAFEALRKSGAGKIITCNTIPHPTNEIDLAPLLQDFLSPIDD